MAGRLARESLEKAIKNRGRETIIFDHDLV
jgi:hypothetical protein